ncbi:hypothetical protein DVH24_010729 [Malus domestica]|uniref:Uncharacterized protein n=1 Tax=Malus domestica TaxID=3750 RepID=A0A498JX99_MALDO|nr:hypothetical protein DVH24_010729 [Malus domestica]
MDVGGKVTKKRSMGWWADSQSNLHCSKTSGFVHQHLAPSVGNGTKSYVGSLSFFHLHHESAKTQEP